MLLSLIPATVVVCCCVAVVFGMGSGPYTPTPYK